MDRIERIEHPQESLLMALKGQQAELWTTLPGIVQDFDVLTMTVSVQPAIQALLTNQESGVKSWVNLPLLVDVPIVISSSGGMSVTMPISKGDECLVSFSCRCIDAWWQSGNVDKQADFRMHDLSDGFAFIGPRSLKCIIQNYSTSSMQIRSDDGAVKIDVNPATHAVTIVANAIVINGPLTVNGNIESTGTVKNNGKNIGSTHTHGGVQTGTGTTGVVS